MQHLDEHTCNICLKNRWNIGNKKAKNIRVQLLQHMQHLDLLLRYPFKTFATYLWSISNTWNRRLQHVLSSATSTYCLDENGGSSTRSLTSAWSLMLRSGAEVADVELVDGTNLGRGHDSRNERSINGRREYGRGGWDPSHKQVGLGVHLTEPNRSVLWLFRKFGHQKMEIDRLVSKFRTEQVRSRLVRFCFGHNWTNGLDKTTIK
jgi:hypothetical protein